MNYLHANLNQRRGHEEVLEKERDRSVRRLLLFPLGKTDVDVDVVLKT